MSLTSLLNSKYAPELKEKMRTVFPNPGLKTKEPLLAPALTKRYSIVGTAFDYLLRFNIQAKYPAAGVRKWVATSALEVAQDYFERKKQRVLAYQGKGMMVEDFMLVAKEQLEKVEEYYNQYVCNPILTQELVEGVLLLAELDILFRSGHFSLTFGTVDKDDVSDLRALMQVYEENEFDIKGDLYLNPTFGSGSQFIGGADADLIIDGLLIDVKVVSEFKLQRKYLNQLLGYYLLSQIEHIMDGKDKGIHSIGIYFARHGYLWQMPVADILEEANAKDLLSWFVYYIPDSFFNGFREDVSEMRNELKKVI